MLKSVIPFARDPLYRAVLHPEEFTLNLFYPNTSSYERDPAVAVVSLVDWWTCHALRLPDTFNLPCAPTTVRDSVACTKNLGACFLRSIFYGVWSLLMQRPSSCRRTGRENFQAVLRPLTKRWLFDVRRIALSKKESPFGLGWVCLLTALVLLLRCCSALLSATRFGLQYLAYFPFLARLLP